METIDRKVDAVRAYNFLNGSYYRIQCFSKYYCPEDFWKPTLVYENKQQNRRMLETRQELERQQEEDLKKEEEHRQEQEEQETEERSENYIITEGDGDGSASSSAFQTRDKYMPLIHEGSYYDELLRERVDTSEESEISDELLGSVVYSLGLLTLDNKELDSAWL